MQRSTSFGFGKKITFPPMLRHTPSPDAYNITSLFDSTGNAKRGFTFGLSREYYTNLSFKRRIPGPGDYTELKVMGNCGRKYSFRSRPSTACTFSPYI